ncbi:MAG: radical SAM protein [Candidatus Helarchaeota archaeon]|nr:radical SAM protein [Candidatus Helarchaeota archaeon]
MIELLIWNLVHKLSIQAPFRIFTKQCTSCGRKFSEIFIDYYLNRQIICKKCKLKTIFYSKILAFVFNLVERTLKMPKSEFRRVLSDNVALKRLALSYIEGIGTFGLRAPQVPAGPIITLWSITEECNMDCTHCYFNRDSSAHIMSFEEVCATIDQLYSAKNLVLGFSGGEPLLREDIFDIIQYASQKSMRVALASNGILITQQVAKRLKDSGAGYVQISIDGLEDIHDQIRGKGVFQKAIAGIKHCIQAGLYVSMDVVITKLNVHQIHRLIDLAKTLNIQKFEVLDFVPSGKAAQQTHLALSPLQIEQFGIFLCTIWQKLIAENYPLTLSYKNPVFSRILAQRFPNAYTIPFFKGIFPKDALKFFNFSNRLSKGIFGEQTPFSPFITGCESGIYVIHIKPNGDVTPCPLNPVILGNVKNTHIQQIWQRSPVLNQYRNLKFKGSCGKCVYKCICGGCRAKTFLASNSYIQSDPTCRLVENQLNKRK